MKKNLKIVSAAAAALLAVAPVAATAVTSADTVVDFNGNSGSSSYDIPAVNDHTINVGVNINAVAGHSATWRDGVQIAPAVDGSISGSINATINGKTVQANLTQFTGAHNATGFIYNYRNHEYLGGASIDAKNLRAGYQYYARMNQVSFNLGNNNRNKEITLHGLNGVEFQVEGQNPAMTSWVKTVTLKTDNDGVIRNLDVRTAPFTAVDKSNTSSIAFYDKANGHQVTTGDVSLNATNGKLNVSDIKNAIDAKYTAEKVDNGVTPTTDGITQISNDEIVSALRSQHIDVASDGSFTVPSSGSFNLNLNAKNNANGKTATLGLTVNVPNVKPTVDEYAHTTRVWNKKASYIYNDKHVRQGNNIMYKIGSGHNVVANADGTAKEYTIAGGVKAYKLSDGYYKGDYVDVRNFQTTRVHVNNNHKTAKVRSRVFDVRGKAVKRMYINKGATVRVYGTKTIKGHKMYKIAKHNRYVKVANFR